MFVYNQLMTYNFCFIEKQLFKTKTIQFRTLLKYNVVDNSGFSKSVKIGTFKINQDRGKIKKYKSLKTKQKNQPHTSGI